VCSSRGSIDRDKKNVDDAAVETYDNVPSDCSFAASPNGFVSITTSNHRRFVIYSLDVPLLFNNNNNN